MNHSSDTLATARTVRWGFLLAAILAAQPGFAQPAPTLDFDADSVSFDLQANRVAVEGLRYTEGALRITADRALVSNFDTDASEWQLSGNVRLTSESGALEADEAASSGLDAAEWRLAGDIRISLGTAAMVADNASFLFADGQLTHAELTGMPATFEDSDSEREEPIRGGANRLEYDATDRTLRMLDGAWLSEGANEFRGCDLVYDFERERVTSGTSDCGEPLRIRIQPPPGGGGADDTAPAQ